MMWDTLLGNMAAEPETDRHGGAPTQDEHREQLASIFNRARMNAMKDTIDRKHAELTEGS